MNLKDLKKVAEKFRAIADNQAELTKLAHLTIDAHPEKEVVDLCERFKNAADAAAVEALADEVAQRKDPPPKPTPVKAADVKPPEEVPQRHVPTKPPPPPHPPHPPTTPHSPRPSPGKPKHK
jgi:hypothetical protein